MTTFADKFLPLGESFEEENRRLKRGDFTEEELQNLCHNLDETKRQQFFEGCQKYQKKLFGCSENEQLREIAKSLAVMLAKYQARYHGAKHAQKDWEEVNQLLKTYYAYYPKEV